MQVGIERTGKEPLARGGVLCAGSAPTRTAELRRFRGGERRTGSEATRRTASRTRLRSTCAGRCLPFGGGGAHAHRTPRRTARSCRPCSGSRQPNSTPSRSPCAGRRRVRLPGLRRGCQRRPGSHRGCADCLRNWAMPEQRWNQPRPGALTGAPGDAACRAGVEHAGENEVGALEPAFTTTRQRTHGMSAPVIPSPFRSDGCERAHEQRSGQDSARRLRASPRAVVLNCRHTQTVAPDPALIREEAKPAGSCCSSRS